VGKGTRLGLSTCYGLVTQKSGHITVDSAPGKGTSFDILLLRVHDAVDFDPLHDGIGYLPVGAETFMLVEDELTVPQAVSYVLREQGYEVIEASNGLEALRMVESYGVDDIQLLVTDMVMPLMGGVELVEEFRALRPNAKVPFVSGYIDDAMVNRVIKEERADHMQKPFTPAMLARKVREILDRQSDPLPAALGRVDWFAVNQPQTPRQPCPGRGGRPSPV